MNQQKKGRLVGGIILAAIGVIGLGGMGTTDEGMIGAYIIVCLLFIAGGLVLILTYVKSRNVIMQRCRKRITVSRENRKFRTQGKSLKGKDSTLSFRRCVPARNRSGCARIVVDQQRVRSVSIAGVDCKERNRL